MNPMKRSPMSAMLMMAGMFGGMPTLRLPRERPQKKCLLPGCEKETRHNGGYCCAAHCREHKDSCGGCVHDGKSSCMDRPCAGCPHEKHQLNKKFKEEL